MRQFMWFLFLLLTLPTLLADVAFGEDQRAPIDSDRPGYTVGPNLMTPGESQIELGYTYNDWDKSDTGTSPEILIRYGLNDTVELRFGWDGYVFTEDDKDFAKGITFGWKKKLKDAGDHWLRDELTSFSLALISTYTIPTGHGPNDFETRTVIGWNLILDETTSLSGNLGYASPTDVDTSDRFIQGVASIMYTKSISDTTSWFGELYTNVPAADDGSEEYVLQGGFAHRLNNDSQFDFRVGVGLNDEAPDWLVGVGFSYRF